MQGSWTRDARIKEEVENGYLEYVSIDSQSGAEGCLGIIIRWH
jgi:hypothetical protein